MVAKPLRGFPAQVRILPAAPCLTNKRVINELYLNVCITEAITQEKLFLMKQFHQGGGGGGAQMH